MDAGNMGLSQGRKNQRAALLRIYRTYSTILLMFFFLNSPLFVMTSHAAVPRFVDLQNGTVYDTISKLIWLKDAGCFNQRNWDSATAAANSLANGQCGLTDGSAAGDWHLPSVDELRIFTDAGILFNDLNTAGFNKVQGNRYWSGSVSNVNFTQASYVDMAVSLSGAVGVSSKSDSYSVWPVRSAFKISPATASFGPTIAGMQVPTVFTISNISPEDVSGSFSITGADASQFTVTPGGPSPCPGYVLSYFTAGTSCTVNVSFKATTTGPKSANFHVAGNSRFAELDAALSGIGVARFVDLQNGTIFDPVTKLTWLKDANCYGILNWYNATTIVNNLSSGQCFLSDGSVAGGWLLPTIDELRKLIDDGYDQGTLNAAGFNNVQQYGYYWSSSTNVDSPESAWMIGIQKQALPTYGSKEYLFENIWPVRNKQSGSSGTLNISTPHTFENTFSGMQSAPAIFTIANGSATAVTVSAIVITGADASQYSVALDIFSSTSCSSLKPTIQAGQGCTVNVTFKPTSPGLKSASFSVVSNSILAPWLTASLSGTGVARFVNLQNGTMYDSVSKLIWPRNANCPGPRNWGSANAFAGSLASGQCGLADGSAAGDWHLPSIDELRLFVDAGFRFDTLNTEGFIDVQSGKYWSGSINPINQFYAFYADMQSGGIASSSMTSSFNNVWPVRSGQAGSSASLQISPAAVNFGITIPGTKLPTVFTISNGGSSAISLSEIRIAGTDSNQFSVTPGGSNPCSSLKPTLAPGASCTVNVNFIATITGAKSASLRVTGNGLITTVDAALSGTGAARFVDLKNGTQYDPVSRLIWLKNVDCYAAQDWYKALALAYNLVGGQCGLTGKSDAGDWHLPSIDELHTIIDAGFRFDTLNLAGFSKMQPDWFWSSSNNIHNSSYAQSVSMFNGSEAPHDKSADLLYAWPVRSGQAGSAGYMKITPATATFAATMSGALSSPTVFTITNDSSQDITVSSASIAGQDASQFNLDPAGGPIPCKTLTPTLAAGSRCTVTVSFRPTSIGTKSGSLHVVTKDTIFTTLDATVSGDGDARFIDLQNGTLYDPVSKLIWLKNAGCFAPQNFDSAIVKSTTLANGLCSLTDGSSSADWHLPSIDELRIFVDAGFRDDTLNAAGFSNVQSSGYWSGSDGISASFAWVADMGFGGLNYNDKTMSFYVWPVRSGLTGTSGYINLFPATTTFPVTVIGTASVETIFTIRNDTRPVSVSSIAIAGTDSSQFSVAPGGPSPCSSLAPTLNEGASCTVNVTFLPTSTGAKSASLHVVSNSRITILDAALSGTGEDRFVDLQNGTMYDNVSKLVWLKNANCFGTQNWGNAVISANTLTSGLCGLLDGSVAGDWHLPTLDELLVFVRAGYRTDSLNNAGFSDVQLNAYWSSSASVVMESIEFVYLDTGSVWGGPKTNNLHVWPVRRVIYPLAANKTGSGTGSITPDSGIISWVGNTGTTNYQIDTVVKLLATPDSTSRFQGWSGACTSDPCSVTVDAPKSVTATFDLAPVAINAVTFEPYSSLFTALSNVPAGTELWMLDTQFSGAFTLVKNLFLKGGWNATYQNKNGLPTTLSGSLTILNGDSTADTVVVKGKLAVQSGSLRVKDVQVMP